jgi:hypothetical protein
MSMIGHLRQITLGELQQLQQNPKLVREFLHAKANENASNLVGALERVQKIGIQAAATGTADDPHEREKIRSQIMNELESSGVELPGEVPGEEGLSLEKSWHCLHYLLTGTAEDASPPLGNAILGGSRIGDDLGYGPARFLTPELVRQVAEALSKLSAEDLAQRFDIDSMVAANIYGCEEKDELEIAQYYFGKLVRYYADASRSGNAMLLYLG